MDNVISISVALILGMIGFMFISLGLDRIDRQERWAGVIRLVKVAILAGTIFGILSETILFRSPYEGQHFVFTPFLELYYVLQGNRFYIGQILLNILLYIPLGFALRTNFWKTNWKKCLVICLLLSLAIELIQGFGKLGVYEVDDIINNTLGGVIGYGCHWFLRRKIFHR